MNGILIKIAYDRKTGLKTTQDIEENIELQDNYEDEVVRMFLNNLMKEGVEK